MLERSSAGNKCIERSRRLAVHACRSAGARSERLDRMEVAELD